MIKKFSFLALKILLLLGFAIVLINVTTFSERRHEVPIFGGVYDFSFEQAYKFYYRFIYDDDFEETIEEVDQDYIFFTEKMFKDPDGTSNFTVYFNAKFELGYTAKGFIRTDSIVDFEEGTLSGRAFEKTNFSSLNGFNKEDFRQVEINYPKDYNGWIQVDFYHQSELVWSLPYFINPTPKNKICFVTNTLNFDAYYGNPIVQGARTNYTNPKKLPGEFTRPNLYPVNFDLLNDVRAGCGHLLTIDSHYWEYFEDQGVKFDLIDDNFLSNYENVKDYDVFILGTHDEYWYPETFETIKKIVDNGGSLIILGGNTAYRVFENVDDYKGITYQKSKDNKDYYNIIHDYLGSYYDKRGYYTFAPYQKMESHPLTDGLPLIFGLESNNDCKTQLKEGEVLTGIGASGWETDKRINDSFKILAKGINPDDGGADIVYKEFENGAKVLNVGSLSFVGALNDQGTQKFLDNLIAYFELNSPSGTAE